MNEPSKIIIETLQPNVNQAIDIINKIDNFYNNAWNKLILFGSITFILVGIIIPLFIQWYQKRTMILSETRLKENIIKELSNTINEKFKEHEKQIKMLNASASSKILFSQAKFSIEKNSYKNALGELVMAANYSMACDDYKNLQEILVYILDNCLSNLSLEEIDDLKTANDVCDLPFFLSELSKKDDRYVFQTKIGEIRVLLNKLPKTIQGKPETKPKA